MYDDIVCRPPDRKARSANAEGGAGDRGGGPHARQRQRWRLHARAPPIRPPCIPSGESCITLSQTLAACAADASESGASAWMYATIRGASIAQQHGRINYWCNPNSFRMFKARAAAVSTVSVHHTTAGL
jgi:hypothetical protein